VEQIKQEYSKKMKKSNVTNAFPSNWVHGMINLTTFMVIQFKLVVATLLWPSVGVKPNTWKK
jgi:hypothetical protein